MRTWNFWLNSLILSCQYHPPRFVELLMLTLAIAMLAISIIVPDRPYIILGLSLVVGASTSILVREAMFPHGHNHTAFTQQRITQVTALLLLGISIYGFADLIHTL
ncbi:hypothetical protein FJR11_20190 [Anabaena sp. UHCC 0187]|uniref:hypothetical protein n=1 Tax=Anabaena sp. UHCC 0187 TaxID=2590018 RepID=UPI0014489417|nr:hypothetical protein [Anabaena sp. UHCC 0187]MDP5018293.1 hypothetical protein [Dolichospermum sp.]MTJ14852.1 hypothetical protein [Anabaena sp. UHCC 0187]